MGERRSQSRSQPRNSPDDESGALSMNPIRTGPAWAISSSSLPASSQRERISPRPFQAGVQGQVAGAVRQGRTGGCPA